MHGKQGYQVLPSSELEYIQSTFQLPSRIRQRRKGLRFLLSGVSFGLLYVYYYSHFRHLWVEQSNISCEPKPWYKLAWGQEYYTREEAVSEYAVSRNSTSSTSAIGHIQVCSRMSNSKYVHYLLDQHKQYAIKHGLEYQLYVSTQAASGVWFKIDCLLRKMTEELRKPASERLSWLFYSDVDTVIFNDCVALDDFLPPDDPKHNKIWLMISNDGNGMNAGAFFLRVDERSKAFLQAIKNYPTHNLEFYEQSVMRIISVARQLERIGEMVIVQPRYIILPGRPREISLFP